MATIGPDIRKSALIVVDMQNDFLHEKGQFARLAKERPEKFIVHEFLASTIPNIKKLQDAFRAAGRPVVYIAHVLKSDYSDASFPWWRFPPQMRENKFIVEGTWGADIVDELKPQKNEHLVMKKGYGGFNNTPLDTILRNLGINTCVVVGVTTCVCVSTTVRGAIEHNYPTIVIRDAVAETSRELHEAELKVFEWAYADVKATAEVLKMLEGMK